MDREVIDRKLDALRRCVARVRARRPATLEQLIADQDAQDVLVLNLSRAVQVCVDIGAHRLSSLDAATPMTMGETFIQLARAGVIDTELSQRLRRAVGFRSIAVHNYDVIDWAIVFALAGEPLKDFDQFAVEVFAGMP